MHLEGRLPTEPRVAGDRRPLIQDGEAWVSAELLAQVLGIGPTRPVSPAAVPAGWSVEASAFTTFEVAKPIISRPAPPPPAAPRRRSVPELAADQQEASAWCDVTAADGTLSLSSVTAISGLQMRGVYQEIEGLLNPLSTPRDRLIDANSPLRRTLAYMLLEMQDGGQHATIGDMFDPLFGPSTGIKLLSGPAEQPYLGAAVLVPRGLPGEPSRGRLELQAGTGGSHLNAQLQLAAGGSYRLFTQWEQRGGSAYSSIANVAGAQTTDMGWRHELGPRLTLFGLAATRSDAGESNANLVGLRWDGRRMYLSVERRQATESGQQTAANIATALFHSRDCTAIVRYALTASGTGRSGLELSLSRASQSGRQVFLSTSAPQADEPRTYSLGARWPLRSHLRANIALELGPSGLHPDLRLEWRRSRDHFLTLRYGPLQTDADEYPSSRGLVFLMTIPFGESAPEKGATGSIAGRVRDDSGRGVPDLRVILDGSQPALTDSDGAYRFTDVEAGKHTIQVDPQHIHADLGGDTRERQVSLSPAEERRSDFLLTRLCRISGRVLVEYPGSTVPVGMGGVIIELSTGEATVTDESGGYQFAGLLPGRYEVTPPTDRNPLSGLTPLPPMSWSLQLKPGDQATNADFRFLRPAREIQFDLVSD